MVFGLIVDPGRHDPGRPPVRCRSPAATLRRPGAPEPPRAAVRPVDSRPDLRPRRQPARRERAHVHGDGARRRPAPRASVPSSSSDWRGSWTCPRPTSSRPSTAPPARASTPFGSPRRCRPTWLASSPRSTSSCRASRSSRRLAASTSTARWCRTSLGYTGAVSPEDLERLRGPRLPQRRHHRQGRRRGHLRGGPARHLRHRAGRAGRAGTHAARPRDAPGARGRALARADHRPRHPARGREGAALGDGHRRPACAAWSSS